MNLLDYLMIGLIHASAAGVMVQATRTQGFEMWTMITLSTLMFALAVYFQSLNSRSNKKRSN